jgi:PAS domain S-box-containing protein
MNSSKTFTILNVDDDDAGRYAKSRILERAGYAIVEAATGASALQLVKEVQPALVLLDIRLPDIDGHEVCRAIKNDPATATTMVLQISAFEISASDRIKSLEGGADGRLSEPVDAGELIAAARALLRLWERERENRRLLAELAESEAHFRALFESTAVGMCEAESFTGRLRAVNLCFCQIVGYSETELIGRSLLDLAHPEDRDSSRASFHALSAGEMTHYRVENRCIQKSGDVVWVDVTVNQIRGAAGAPVRALAVVNDITQRKRGEAAQREIEHRFRELANLMPQIVFTAAPEGRLDFLNNQWARYAGDSAGCVRVDGWDGFLHPDDAKALQQCWRAAQENGAPYELECRLRGKDGRYRWLLNRTVAMKDEQGRISRWVGTWTDIDSSKRLHEALRESEERLRMAVKAAGFGTYDVDVERDEVYCSPELRAICGLSDAEPMCLEGAIQLIHPDDRSATVARVLEPFTTVNEAEYEAEFRVVRADGEVRWVFLRGRGYRFRDGERQPVARGLGTVIDITPRKRAEEQLRQQNDRLQLLAKAAEQLLVANDPTVMMGEVFATVQHHLGLDGYLSYSIDEGREGLVLEASAGIPAELARAYKRLSFGQALCGAVARSRAPKLVERLQDSVDPNASLDQQAGFRACVCHPLLVGDRLLGVLSFASRHRDSFEPDEIESMRTICHYVAMAKERLRLLDQARAQAEHLAKNELRLQLSLDTANVGIYEWQLRTVQAIWDDRLRAHWGVRPGAPITYDTFMQGIHPDDRATAQAAMEPALDPASDGRFHAEFRVIGRDDGIERWITTRGQVFYENGRPARLLGTTFDRTERKREELELLSLRDRLAVELAEMTRLHQLNTALLVENDLDAMLNRVLDACTQLLGTDKGTLQVYDEDEKRLKLVARRGFDEAFADRFNSVGADASSCCGQALRLRERVVIADLADRSELAEYAETLRRHGVRAVQSTPILSKGKRILGMISTYFDKPYQPSEREMRLLDLYAQQAERVIERTQAEEALRKSEERLALALDASGSGVWDLDLIRNQAAVSQSFRALHGMPADEPATYETWLARLNKQDRQQLIRYSAKLLRKGMEFNFEYRVQHPGLGERWLAAVGRVVRDAEARPIRLIGVNTDITARKRSELARAQLAAIVETSDDAIIGADLSGSITSWNGGAERLYGYTAAEVIGRPISLLIPEERREEELATFQRIRQGETIENYEAKRRRKDGSDIDVSLTLSAVRNDRGTIIGASKIARDISARLVAEETLWHSEEQLRLAQTAAHVGIWDWDPGNDRLSWSAEMLNLYGLSQPLHSYAEWRKLVHADDLPRIEAERAEALRSQQVFNIDYRIMHGSGEIRWISSRGQGWYHEDGRVLRVLGINMDVTDRKRAEADVRESERRFRALADSAPVLIWIQGPEGIQFVNQAYRDFAGVGDDADLAGYNWTSYIHPDDRDAYTAAYFRAVANREPFEADFRMRRADGEYRWMKSRAMPRATIGAAAVTYAGCTIDIHDAKLAEAQLALLAAVVNSSQDAIYSFTLDTTIVSWNRAAEALFGWTEAEILGKKWNRFLPPQLSEELNRIVELVQSGQVVTGFETQRLHKDGSAFDVSLAFSPVVAQGRIIAISAIARDITYHKIAEAQRDQQARLLDLSLDAIIVWSSPACTIEYWNQGAEKLYGYAAGEVYGRSIHDVLKPSFPISQAEIEAKIDQEGEWDGRLLHTQKSGGRVAVLSRMQRITRPGGNVVLEVNRDITVIEEAEQAVAEAAAHLNAIVETAVDGIITIDERGIIESFNPAAEKIFGYSAGDISGREIALLMPELALDFGADGRTDRLGAGRRRIDSGTETRGRRKDGREFPVDFGVSETAMGEARFYTALVRDATARKEAEQALIEAKNAADAANRAKSEFLANMSHEIRNPMTGIMGYADILLDRLQDQGALECVRTIKDSGHYLLQIINDLLDLAKIEAQGLQLEKEDIHLPTFLTDVYTLMEGAARAKGLPLSLKYDGVIPYEIESDPKRLRQILINLLGNAIKFTDRGGVELAVRFDAAQAQLQLRVSDSGIGMTAEQQQNLFRPFAQGDSSMTKTYGGTGLGLAITKRLVEALGGQIGVDSVSGQGSTFRVTLPVLVLSGGAYRDTEISARMPVQPWRKRIDARVMIVEDQPDIRRLMEYFIAAAGAVVTTFSSGETALAQLRQQPDDFDVILMDIQMPRMDGFETTRRMRALGFTRSIIAVTAGAMAGDQANCLAAGCSDYVSKPIDMATLLDRISLVLSRRQPAAGQEHERRRGEHDATGPELPIGRNGGDSDDPERPRVLVVDDHQVALNATKSLLEMHGCDVRTAATGHAGIRIASEFLPHYVFLDISLPDISGYEVFRRLKGSEALRGCKFIALSGHGHEESVRARRAGFDAYMTKPVDIREMQKLISATTETAEEKQ